MEIQLSSTTSIYIMGWYGTCENESPFPLASIEDKLFGVYQLNSFGTILDMYNPNKEAWASHPYENLNRGYSYLLIFNTVDANAPAEDKVVNIPGFVSAKHQGMDTSTWPPSPLSPGEGYGRITDSCDSGPPGPAPSCTATATLKSNNTVAEIVIDWNEVTNEGTQDGKIQAVEVVFDNIVFAQGATTSGAAGKPVVTADWGGLSNSDIDNFKNTTGAFMDLSVRDNGSLPTQQETVFGMISFLPGLTLLNYQNQAGSTWTFEVPVVSVGPDTTGFGTEPVISEVRILDASPSVLKYGVTEC